MKNNYHEFYSRNSICLNILTSEGSSGLTSKFLALGGFLNITLGGLFDKIIVVGDASWIFKAVVIIPIIVVGHLILIYKFSLIWIIILLYLVFFVSLIWISTNLGGVHKGGLIFNNLILKSDWSKHKDMFYREFHCITRMTAIIM